MSSDKRLYEISQAAAKRILVAAELLTQLAALQSFEDQDLVDRIEAREEMIKIIDQFHAEVEEVTRLVDSFVATEPTTDKDRT